MKRGQKNEEQTFHRRQTACHVLNSQRCNRLDYITDAAAKTLHHPSVYFNMRSTNAEKGHILNGYRGT